MNLLITGDCLFEPKLLQKLVEETFGPDKFNIRVKRFSFGETSFPVDSGMPLPSGMAFENPSVKAGYEDYGVSEFYGHPLALYDEIKDAEILVIHGAALPRKVIENAPNLRAVITLRGGPANIDTECLKERDIRFYNTPGKNAQAVAEFVLGEVLDFERGYTCGNTQLKDRRWWIKAISDYESHELQYKTWGLIGYGRIARCLRELLSGFRAEILAYDPYVADSVLEEDTVTRVTLEELVKKSHYISLHARAEKGAPPLMDARLISMMQPDAVLINSARGALVDHTALKNALTGNRIRGAVLDVLGNEPFGFYEGIIDMQNAFITPHIAGSTLETVERGYRMAIDQLKSFMNEDSGGK